MSYRYISIEIREQARFQLSRILAAGLLLIWICRLCLGIGISQLMQPIFSDTKADRFYWLLDHLGILDVLINYMPLSFGVDILLFLLPVLMIAYPSNRIFALIYLATLVLYFSAYNVTATHQEHTLIGAIAVAFLLCFKDNLRFSTVFSAVRYYVCFLMTSAFFWKFSRGALWHEGQMTNILKNQHAAIIYQTDNTLYSSWINYLIDNPIFANTLWWIAAMIELSFIIGFFSKRFDSFLFFLFWLFILADFLVMGLHFWELGLLSLLFLKGYSKLFD
jgi:hypothetical protein